MSLRTFTEQRFYDRTDERHKTESTLIAPRDCCRIWVGILDDLIRSVMNTKRMKREVEFTLGMVKESINEVTTSASQTRTDKRRSWISLRLNTVSVFFSYIINEVVFTDELSRSNFISSDVMDILDTVASEAEAATTTLASLSLAKLRYLTRILMPKTN